MKSSQRVFVSSTIFRLLVLIPAVITLSLSSSRAQDCQLSIEEVMVQHTCEGMEMGMIKVQVQGAVGKYDLKWAGPGKLSRVAVQKNLGPGSYKVTVTDESSCKHQLSIKVNSNRPPKVTPVLTESSLELDIKGNGPFKVKWNSTQKEYKLGETVIKSPKAGNYTYVVSDHNNCFDVGVVSVTDNNE